MKSVWLLLIACGMAMQGSAQTTLSFCTSVEKNGYCAFNNTRFITPTDSTTGRIYMLIENNAGLGVDWVQYKLYSIDKSGTETFIKDIEQNLEGNWIYAWQINNFSSPGKFRVKVVSPGGQEICNRIFELLL